MELANKHKLKPGTSAGTSPASEHFQKHVGQHHSEILNQQQSVATEQNLPQSKNNKEKT
jgi:hypothetical protein